MMIPANNMDVKRTNRINTLRCLLGCERISQPELAQRLNLSWPTVLQNVRELAALGLVAEVGECESTGGRKAKAYAPVKAARLAVGIDITPNHVGLVLVNLSGEVVHYTRKKLVFSLEETYFTQLGSLFTEFTGTTDTAKICGVGVSLPGIVDQNGSYLVNSHVVHAFHMPTSRFEKVIPYPCTFLNDANAAGLAEVWGKSKVGDQVYLSLSNSVGGAIIREGRMYTGKNMRAGEFGHMTLIHHGRRCYCGKDGCLDAYCSAKELSKHTDGDLARFFELLCRKDSGAEAIWQEYIGYLAVAINNLHMSFDCDVILGGYVGAYMEGFDQELRQLVAGRNTFDEDASYVKICRYKKEASAVGAALTQIEAFIQTL